VIRIVPGERTEWIDADGVSEFRVRSPQPKFLGGYRMVARLRAVRRVLSEVKPDVIEVSDKCTLVGVAGWCRRRWGSAVVLVSHERLDGILRQRVPRWFPLEAATSWWNRRLVRHVDAVVAPSRYAAAEFVGRAQIEVVPWGVDRSVFRPSESATEREAPVQLVTVGRLSAEKRPWVAIEILRELRQRGIAAHLTVVGDGPDREILQASAAGLPVTWTGHLAQDAVARTLAAADVAIAPCDVETFGLAALESMACGTPVVVAAGGALSELVADHGATVDVRGSASQWADATLSLLQVDRDEMRRRCIERAEHFSWHTASTTMLRLFHSLATRHQPTSMGLPWELAGPWFEV
jgi:alpha-1,6-mannosyltransferase